MLRRFSTLISRFILQAGAISKPPSQVRRKRARPGQIHPAADRATLKQTRAPFPSLRSQRRSSASTRCPISSRRTDRKDAGGQSTSPDVPPHSLNE